MFDQLWKLAGNRKPRQALRTAARACCAVVLFFLPASIRAQSTSSATRIDLEQAIQLALTHNHALQAVRTVIRENESQEITANLRPNPAILWDAQFLPIFEPHQFSADYIDNTAQFDLGIGYLFERGKKRQHRLQAARDQTAVTRFVVADNERAIAFQVGAQFINVLLAESTLDFAQENLKSLEKALDISETRFKAGDISEGDFLKLKLQRLQFQTDASMAQLAKVQALAALRQLLGYESVPADYDVAGQLDYQSIAVRADDLQARALRERPDLRAAERAVTAAQSQFSLARANAKRDLSASFNYTHLNALHLGATFFSIQLPIFDRNQGEIARTRFAIGRTEEAAKASSEQVLTEVRAAFEGLRTNDQIIQLYRSGYLDQAKQSLDISEFAYKRGAVSLLDFLDAERSYRVSQLGYRQTLAAYMLSVEQLKQVVGTRTLGP
jgi:cobalt-zinc-cadmium efflux system outer membrane protein